MTALGRLSDLVVTVQVRLRDARGLSQGAKAQGVLLAAP